MRTDDLREMYLEFFETKGCVRRPSDVLVPKWDPSVLFTPAGMNQFKDHFLGRCKLEYTKATTCQKCLRTGDIENVGRTAYHHTFFEMLGNFSFGDYFKREAIHWAWEFLTDKKWLALAPERLSATVYKDDEEAAKIWLNEIKISSASLSYLDEDENFWPASAPSQGPDGVCGPCSEIYFETDGGSVVEIWNLVFTQFNRVGDPPNNLEPLPSKNIDTGMGLERTAAALQNVETNYHIDILLPLVEAAAEVCGVKYVADSEEGRRLRRITDHVRACAFAVHENVYPGPQKEKYVIRRLLRRAALDGRQLGRQEPFLHELVPVVAEIMKPQYPELTETLDRVSQVIKTEETSFGRTIDGGLSRIGKIFDAMKSVGRPDVSGEDAFDMYQTYGFPPELFESLAAEQNFGFDWSGYQERMEQHGADDGAERGDLFKQDPLEALKKTGAATEFTGFDSLTTEDAKVVGIVAAKQLVEQEDEVSQERPITLILDRSSFYGEKGGQVGDKGEIVGEGFKFQVKDTKVDGTLTLHVGHLLEGKIKLDDRVVAEVDVERRAAIQRAHTATHLLHASLRKNLGQHAEQQGSKVEADALRFDFTNLEAVPSEVLDAVEDEVNAVIVAGQAVDSELMPLDKARKSGAMMLFGEKYPDEVRVVTIGDFSAELCGGTHIDSVSKIGLVKVVREESVSAGTRRIVALTGLPAFQYLRDRDHILTEAAAKLKSQVEEVPQRIDKLSSDIRKLKKEVAAGAKSGDLSPEALLKNAVEIEGVKVVLAETPGANVGQMRELIDLIRRKASPSATILAAKQGDDKVLLIAGLTRDLVDRGLNAVEWLKPSAKAVGGGGGGRPDMAQAGGKKPGALPEAFKIAKETLAKSLEE
jgi:alanyl-tRNA synthetase